MRPIILVLVLTLGLAAGATDARAQARSEFVPSISFSTTYDDNIFTTQQGGGDAMMLVTPAFEGVYESPTTQLRGVFTIDMQRAFGYSTLNSLDAKRHASLDMGFQLTPRFRLSLIGRYDTSDRPGDLAFETGVLLGRQRARRYQASPAIAYRAGPRTTISAQYDAVAESLGENMNGQLRIARFGVSRRQTLLDTWSLSYIGRSFANGADMFRPASSQSSHAVLAGYNRRLSVGTTFSIQAGPRVSSYGNNKPEVLADFSRKMRFGQVGLDYWMGETIIMGIRGPVDIQSASFKSAWPLRRNLEIGLHAGVFNSTTLLQGRARVFHPEAVVSYTPRGPYIFAASYGIDFQKGDVRSEFLSDREVVRHVVLFRLTFAPRLRHYTPSDPSDRRAKGVIR